jgi:RNA polymerase sigma factor (TIGR02999 family)
MLFMTTQNKITQILKAWNGGNKAALDELIPLVYDELHRLAMSRLRQDRAGHTLQATALVNEAYMRLADWQNVDWHNRAHFIGVAAQIMRNILVDYARKHGAEKRGGDRYKISLTAVANLTQERELDLVALDNALQSLAAIDPVQSRVIELRYFGGLSIEETAEVLGVSAATVSREWKIAKMWLKKELDNTGSSSE